ncbi:MAG: restriction endonuclease subunit S [Candidatus Poribacteria bacterium]|nr:restriction endonuclease subunit S [Candidatus Poribacteria bacterium]
MSKTTIHHRFSTGYKQTNLGPLPNTWKAVLLGDLFVFKNGLNKAKGFFGSGTPIVNYMDVFEHPGLRPGDLLGRVNLTPEEIRNFKVQKGDVFFTRTSETVEDIGVASVMLYEPHDTVFSGFVLRARSRDGRLDDHYKQYCFANRVVRSQIISNATYTTRALTNGRTLSTVWIAVPPTPEQRAIAEALSDVDGLINALDALIAKKRAIKQATMQQLLTGRTRLPGFSGAWETKQIGDVASLCSEKNNLGADIPVLTCSKHLGFVDSLSYFKNQVFSKDLSSYKIIRRGQIGYPINHVEEGSIGLQDLYDVALVSPIYVVCSPKKDINSFFLHRLLKLESYRQEFANATTSSINRRGSLRWPVFSKIHVTLPPIDEQVAIAAVLNDVEIEIAALEKRRDKTHAIKQSMMQQLLTGRVRLLKSE